MYGNSSEYKTKHHHGFPASVVGPNHENTHLEHCLDRLRQAVMCYGDLTPALLFTFKDFPIALGKSGKQTCRKFEPIGKWMDQRGKVFSWRLYHHSIHTVHWNGHHSDHDQHC